MRLTTLCTTLLAASMAHAAPKNIHKIETSCEVVVQTDTYQLTRSYDLLNRESFSDLYEERSNGFRFFANAQSSGNKAGCVSVVQYKDDDNSRNFLDIYKPGSNKIFDEICSKYETAAVQAFASEGTHVTEEKQCKQIYDCSHGVGVRCTELLER